MAIIVANRDGTSNAKAGDVVVTGGGIFKKNEDGSSTPVGKLPTTTGTSKDYNVVLNTYREMVGLGSGNSSSSGSVQQAQQAQKQNTPTIDSILNGSTVYDDGINGDSFYIPSYDLSGGSGGASAASGGTFSFSNIFGYIITGLVLLVVLDKLMGK